MLNIFSELLIPGYFYINLYKELELRYNLKLRIMKSIGKFSLGLTLAVFFAFAFVNIQAQPGNDDHHRGMHMNNMPDSCHVKMMADKLAQELSLTDAQKQKVLEIEYSHMKEMKAINAKLESAMDEARKAHEKVKQAVEGEVKVVLNDDQKVKYDEFLSKRQDSHHGEHGDHQEKDNGK